MDAIADESKNTKRARLVGVVSFVAAVVIAVGFSVQYFTSASTGTWTVIVYLSSLLVALFAYLYLLFSILALAVKVKPDWENVYNVSISKILTVAVASVYYCLCGPIVLGFNKLNTSFTAIVLAMMLIEVVTVLYACFDLYQRKNLRWFLRTLPYCVTGAVFLLSAYIQRYHAGDMSLSGDSLANAVMSFVTFTYFIQVFNERFCKKQDDCPEAHDQCRPMSAREGFIMMRACDKIKNAMEQLYLADKSDDYILVNPSFVQFSCHTDKPVKHGISNRPGADDTEGILLYNPKTKQYLGYFPEDPVQDRKPSLLPCPNGVERDMTGQEHPAPAPAEAVDGTCTVVGIHSEH